MRGCDAHGRRHCPLRLFRPKNSRADAVHAGHVRLMHYFDFRALSRITD